jgi:hypothetical protein
MFQSRPSLPEEWLPEPAQNQLTERYVQTGRYLNTPRVTITPRVGLNENEEIEVLATEDTPRIIPKLNTDRFRNRSITVHQIQVQKEEAKTELKKLIEQNVDIAARISLLNEIITTEKTYIRSLDLLWHMYYKPLVEKVDKYQKNLFDTPGDVKHPGKMFPPNLSTVMTLNQAFLKKLQDRYDLYDNESMYFLIIGDLFCEMAPFFKAYVTYLSAYERCMAVIRKNREQKSFDKWLDKRKRLPESQGLDIGSLLILPVQRIPRYQLLLKNLLDLTQSDHVDYSRLVEAHDLIAGIGEFQNKRVRETNDQMQIAKLGNRLKLPDLVKPSRKMVHVGDLKIQGFRKCIAHLFNDILLIEEEKSLLRKKKTHEYSLHEAFVAGGDHMAISLSIDADTSLQLLFDTYEEKVKWSDLITKVLLDMQERETENTIKISVDPPNTARERKESTMRRLSVNLTATWKNILTPRRVRGSSLLESERNE